jgi:hypothetical protein
MDPMTAIGIANAALTVVKMFGSGGGQGSFLAQQANMLAAISRQLSAMQATLMQIQQELNRISIAVEELPERVAQEAYFARIAGAQERLRQILEAYDLHVRERGIQSARTEYAPRIRHDVLDDINNAVTDLIASTGSFVVSPAITSAVFAHHTAMVLCDEPPEYVGTQLRAYQTWFKSILDASSPRALPAAIAQKNKIRSEVKHTYYEFQCWTEKWKVVVGQRHRGGRDGGDDEDIVEERYRVNKRRSVNVFTEFEDKSLQSVINELKEAVTGIALRQYNETIETVETFEQVGRGGVVECRCVSFDESMEDRVARHRQATVALIPLYSWKAATEAALNYVERALVALEE